MVHPQLDLIANALTNREGKPWVMVCRTLKETEELARSTVFNFLRSTMEPLGLFGITACEREATVSLGHTVIG